ncbi:Glycosyltransferase [Synechococcus sp. WH 8101]|uniref:glycosyltransferase n=1 Tax=Synechococcus sp. WH 8101 TaxID=59932 RepID=UPI001022D7C9|nr:glycosyltransferase [Synechococcus sp. WH 8101]QBE67804.1 Glycosyltransferase [Synechococcus sp. WH 8101]QNI44000.1 UDP-glycosyltransferase/glycogen phosphorylase [Synechococcus sp. WH 8101]
MADFVVLATADWDHPLWTNKQHTALELAAQGHRVLYVESLGIRPPRVGAADRTRILRRLRRMLQLPRQRRDRLWVWSPPVLPGGHDGLGLGLNRRLLRNGLELACRWIGFRHPILWTYNPLTGLYLDIESFDGSVYHCVDRIQEQPGMPVQRLEVNEERLCRAVDVVFTTSPELQTSHLRWNANTLMFGNVADQAHFRRAMSGDRPCPQALATLPQPRLLFMGAIDAYKLDLELLLQLARRHSEWSLVLIGPVGETDPSTDVIELQACPNVHLMGPRPYGDLPDWLAHADLALLPLQMNGYTRHMFPMKFFEYLASGLPVVATAIPALQPHGDVAWLCPPDPTAFEQAITAALEGQGPTQEQRLERAADHTYASRTRAMLDQLDRVGLLAEAERQQAGPLAGYPSRRERFGQWCTGLGSQLLVALSHQLMRRGHPELALRCLQGRLRWGEGDRILLGGLVLPLVRCGAYGQAREVMDTLWLRYGHLGELKQLLFRRGNRPSEREEQVLLFEELVGSTVLPLHARNYCLVVMAHRCVDLDDQPRMRRCVMAIDAMATGLEQDPGTRLCRRANRRNRTKLLVSCYATLQRLHLGLQDFEALVALGRRALIFFDSLDLNRIDPDTSYRLTRNSLRVLSLNVIEAWRTKDHALLQQALQPMERLRVHCEQECFDDQSAQENHRGFADAMVQLSHELEAALPGDGLEAVRSLLVLMIRSERELSTEERRQRFADQIEPLFRAYLPQLERCREQPLP